MLFSLIQVCFTEHFSTCTQHTNHILRFIQLLAVAKSKDVKEYGIDAILEPAVKDLQVLARVSVAMHDDDTCSIVLL